MQDVIVIEGLDGVGKTTLINNLKLIFDAKFYREPGGTIIGESIRDILLNDSASTLSNYQQVLLVTASRISLYAEIQKELGLTIVDRGLLSTYLYQNVNQQSRDVALQAIIPTINYSYIYLKGDSHNIQDRNDNNWFDFVDYRKLEDMNIATFNSDIKCYDNITLEVININGLNEREVCTIVVDTINALI